MSKNFIHIPKNAGSAIRQSIPGIISGSRRLLNASELVVINSLNKFGMRASYGHLRARDNINIAKKKQGGFSVVRNPWSREYSKYKYLMSQINTDDKKDSQRRVKLVKKYNCNYKDVGWQQGFENYLEMRHEFMDQPWVWLHACESFYSQLSYLVINNKVPDNIIIFRQEHLSDDLKSHGFSTKVKSINVSNSDIDYIDIYTDKTLRIVSDLYKEDIDYFGFDFDNSAVRNVG